MLRPFASGGSAASRAAAFVNRYSNGRSAASTAPSVLGRLMSTQSGDDAAPPTALAKLHLEDGTTLTGRSFGSHESTTGEVRWRNWTRVRWDGNDVMRTTFECHFYCSFNAN